MRSPVEIGAGGSYGLGVSNVDGPRILELWAIFRPRDRDAARRGLFDDGE